MNESIRVRINSSHLSIVPSPSNHQDDATFYFAITFSIGQTDASAENVTRLSERASLSITSQTTLAGAASGGCDESASENQAHSQDSHRIGHDKVL
jgi:hypothetical protein